MATPDEINNNEGFTLVEVVLTLALIGILSYAFFATFRNFQMSNDLDSAVATIAQSARHAQILAQGVSADSDWGIKIFGDRLVMFKGSDYDSRTAAFDEILFYPAPLAASGITEIVFAKFSGEPIPAGSITLSASTQISREIQIGAKGSVSY